MPDGRWRPRTESALNLIQSAAIVLGVFFGLQQLSELERSRELAASLELVSLFQNEDVSRGILRLASLPDSTTVEDILALPPEDQDLVLGLAGTWESLGVLVYRGEVSLALADELFGGLVLLSWDRLGPWVWQVREGTRNPQALEWFQWLAERLGQHREGASEGPAYEAFQDWEP